MIIHGDCLESMKALVGLGLEGTIDCCVTSPPYWGLRDYGVEGQLGLEKTPGEFIEKMVIVFEAVKKLLKPTGTLWLNMGDCYATTGGAGWQGKHGARANRTHSQRNLKKSFRPGLTGIKPKDLCGIPWRVAFALQDAGWYLRQDIIWSKPSPMPESVGDRCTKSHEYIFLLAKSSKYYFDAEAIKEPAECAATDKWASGWAKEGSHTAISHQTVKYHPKLRDSAEKGSFNGKHGDAAFRAVRETRNKRSVWTVVSQPFTDAHFATFPPKLIEPCILAGCPRGGTVLDPFFGAGTTGLVALQNSREFIGIELNPEYIKIAERRLKQADTTPTMFDLATGEM